MSECTEPREQRPPPARKFISLSPATEGVVSELHRHPSVSRALPLATMLSTLRHAGGKRKEGESGAVADGDPDDGDGYAVKMLQRLLDVARPKQATSRSLADTLELVVEEWSVHAAEMQGGTRMRSSAAKSVPMPRRTCVECRSLGTLELFTLMKNTRHTNLLQWRTSP